MAKKVPYVKITRRYARKYHVPARVLAAQQETESGFRPDAVSSAGAFGLTQFMPGTAKGYKVQRGHSKHAVKTQIRGQAKYLHDLGYSKDKRKALAGYAGGPGNPQYSYASLVLGRSKKYKGIGNGPAAKGGGGRGKGGSSSSSSKTTTVTRRTPGVDNSETRKALVLDLLKTKPGTQRSTDPLAQQKRAASDSSNLLSTIVAVQAAKDVPGKVSTKTKTVKSHSKSGGGSGNKGSTDTHAKGTANFEGKTVAKWIKPELVYARRHGWKGTVSSGFRSHADQVRIYNSGVRPAARPGHSNHEGANFPRGAVDVTEAQTLSRILRRKGSKLKFAGAKDPVHFSHPHNGGY